MKLLREPDNHGFPTAYLLARIRGREGRAFAGQASDERIWGAFLSELEWLHAQMNRDLRAMFAPLFGLFELKTIVLAVRSREVQTLLEHTLLSESIQKILREKSDLRSAIAALGDPQLGASYDEGGLRGFENALMRRYLQDVAAEYRHFDPLLKTFFILFIDLRNIMLLYKHLRWEIEAHCDFIAGGSVEASRFEEILARRNHDAFDELVRRLTGIRGFSVAASEGAVESDLLRSLTQRLLKIRRTSFGRGLIVIYIWHVYVQARDAAIRLHAAELDSDVLRRELVL